MYRKRNWLFVFLGLLSGFPAVARSDGAGTAEGITAVMKSQTEAWNRGDLDAFVGGYLQSRNISYVSGGTRISGYDALRESYQSRYGRNRAGMGKLSLTELDISKLGRRHALCVGRWRLERESQPALDGVYSLVFVRQHGAWKIIHDHTSLGEKPSVRGEADTSK